jgi:hypothetical protein
MDRGNFGNWQEFLDDAVQKLQKDVENLKYFRSLKTDVDRIVFAGQFQHKRLISPNIAHACCFYVAGFVFLGRTSEFRKIHITAMCRYTRENSISCALPTF